MAGGDNVTILVPNVVVDDEHNSQDVLDTEDSLIRIWAGRSEGRRVQRLVVDDRRCSEKLNFQRKHGPGDRK